jgi:YidC/Oxa1 family membrane protein insertase
MMSSDQRNLFLAIALSLAILLGFQFFIEQPRRAEQQARQPQTTEQAQPGSAPVPGQVATPPTPGQAGAPPVPGQAAAPLRDQALARAPRIVIDTPRLKGSISLAGGRIDDLVLQDYKQTTRPDSPPIVLLEPPGSEHPYFAEFGFVAAAPGAALPPPDAVWRADRERIGAGEAVTLTWDGGQGLRFTRRIAIDANYLFTVTQRVENSGQSAVSLHPYGLLSRTGTPQTEGFYILHEGLIGVLGGTLREHDYDELQDKGKLEERSEGGWLGITDKYWLATLLPTRSGRSPRASATPWPGSRTSTRPTSWASRSRFPPAVRPSRSTASSPAPRRSRCWTPTARRWACRTSIRRSTSAISTGSPSRSSTCCTTSTACSAISGWRSCC